MKPVKLGCLPEQIQSEEVYNNKFNFLEALQQTDDIQTKMLITTLMDMTDRMHQIVDKLEKIEEKINNKS